MTGENKNTENDTADNVIGFDPRRRPAPPARPPSEPAINLPPATKAVFMSVVLFYAVLWLLPPVYSYDLAFVPARYDGSLDIWAVISPLSYMFLHGGLLHLAVNAGMLMAFGAALEKTIGARRFLAVYILTGVLSAACHSYLNVGSSVPLIGASGAISGLFGSVVMWMHDTGQLARGRRGSRALMPFVIMWVVTSVFFGFFGVPGSDADVAWAVHIAGFMLGLLLYRPVVRYIP